jgi:hypothetical protein
MTGTLALQPQKFMAMMKARGGTERPIKGR